MHNYNIHPSKLTFKYRLLKWWYSLQFDASKQVGYGLSWADSYSNINISNSNAVSMLKYLHDDAELCLPRGLYYELRAKVPENYGRDRGIAWVYTPGMYGEIRFNQPFIYQPGYYFLVGGFLA